MHSWLRLGLFYSAYFVGGGAVIPYMPVWFNARGLSGGEIGLILSLPMLARALTAPLLAVFADSFRERRTPIALMAAAVAALYALLAPSLGFLWLLVVWFAAAILNAMIVPLTDVLALRSARRQGFSYGWPRGMGSVAFILANIAVGGLLATTSPELVLIWAVAAAALTAGCARLLLPADPVLAGEERASAGRRFAGVAELMRNRAFLIAAVSAGLIQSAHAFYYGFSALAWKRQGISEAVTGLLWGLAVAAEVGFLWFMDRWRRRIGPRMLLVLGGAAATVRWAAFAFSPPLWILAPLQLLHAFSFAATYLASLRLVEKLSRPHTASAAQAISAALSGGLLAGLATIASGWLFDRAGAGGYVLAAAMAAVGTAGALRLLAQRRLTAA